MNCTRFILPAMLAVTSIATASFTLNSNDTVMTSNGYEGISNSIYASWGSNSNLQLRIGYLKLTIFTKNGQDLTLADEDPVFAAVCSEMDENGVWTASSEDMTVIGVSGACEAVYGTDGIGADRADQIHYLYNQYSAGSLLSDWKNGGSHTVGDDNSISDGVYYAAFQLATWELTHDSDFDLENTAGDFYLNSWNQSGNDSDIVAYAKEIVADVKENYSINGENHPNLHALQEVTLSADRQDVFVVVPEPATAFVFLAGSIIAAARRRT
ncbi:hypothetical protein SMSP2_01598 [Limihaloglobus sulfuriphilus]|uniref:PEP-CTERM protein-sorting domain-containing protein n=1 Tax=Limihaloglobus sulfuriphilus TaxID=1851148 RepID=A0A1Q2MG39_9BACT|nr:hypothetical protein [Limihaloglobus sulfuriphilus]AQQ71232.1 hypothetical protein SMSP2_01598 [Limihaloglobus sulfuriphilus]